MVRLVGWFAGLVDSLVRLVVGFSLFCEFTSNIVSLLMGVGESIRRTRTRKKNKNKTENDSRTRTKNATINKNEKHGTRIKKNDMKNKTIITAKTRKRITIRQEAKTTKRGVDVARAAARSPRG